MKIMRPTPPRRAILYYPTIKVPTDSWLRQSLLYWDEISSIIPEDLEREGVNHSPEVQYLKRVGVFRPIHPESLVFNRGNWETYKEFEADFKEAIESFLIFYQIDHLSKGKQDTKSWVEIHKDKISKELYNYLEGNGLAREAKSYSWLEFESTTGMIYMSLLAKHLARIQEMSTSIGTQQKFFENLNFKIKSARGRIPIANLSLNELIPVPEENIPFEKILDFKDKRPIMVMRFRNIIVDYQDRIAAAESIDHVREIITSFKEELYLGATELQQSLGESQIKSRLKTVKSLLGLAKYPAIAEGASFIEKFYGLPEGNLSIPALAITGAIEFRINYTEDRYEIKDSKRDSAFSYLFEAHKAGIIKNPMHS